MRKVLLLAYVVIFFILSIIPAALAPLGIGLAGYEKRQLAQMPKLISDSGFNADFTGQFNDYFNDHFGFRNSMIGAWSALNYYLLGTSASSKALAGKDGWLYLSATVDDYRSKQTVTDGQIDAIAEILLEIQQRVRKQGGAFVFVIAPNKNSVYPEYMPESIVPLNGGNNYDRLVSALDALGVSHTDLKSSLAGQKGGELLYHKWDTHWNGYGAWLGYLEILDCAGIEDGLSVGSFVSARDWQGDLLNMVLPGSKKLDEQMYPKLPDSFEYENPAARVDDVDISTFSDVNGQSVLLYRDSFANQLIQYFSNAFGRTRYLRGAPYDLAWIDSEAPDLVIIEIAERNIPELIKNLGITG